jgi:hypothetical protein
MFELKTEHNFSGAPQEILLGSEESLLANMGDERTIRRNTSAARRPPR